MLAVKTIPQNLMVLKREVQLMGIRFEFSVVGNDTNWADERINEAISEINRVEKLISAFSEDSSVNEINRNAGIKPVKTNAEIFRLISRSLEISELTHGSFNIIYYTDDRKDDQKQSSAKKSEIKNQNIVLDTVNQTVFLKDKNMRIGFGSNSMGYATDRAKYILQMNGVSSGVINAGGDIITWGLQPDNSPWTLSSADASQVNHPFSDFVIGNMAVATSVNKVKYASTISKKVSRQINTKVGFPVSGIKSVSILSTSAELADSLSATILQMGINAGLYLINQLNQIGCVIIDDHDRVYTSKGISLSN
jgi:thiamine biosynthesis lipoprotein